MFVIKCSWAPRKNFSRTVDCVQPRQGFVRPECDEIENAGVIRCKITCEHRLMVSDSISQLSNILKIVSDLSTNSARGSLSVREYALNASPPEPIVVTSSEHVLPEGELQVSYDFASGRMVIADLNEMPTRVEGSSARVGKTLAKTRTFGPFVSV